MNEERTWVRNIHRIYSTSNTDGLGFVAFRQTHLSCMEGLEWRQGPIEKKQSVCGVGITDMHIWRFKGQANPFKADFRSNTFRLQCGLLFHHRTRIGDRHRHICGEVEVWGGGLDHLKLHSWTKGCQISVERRKKPICKDMLVQGCHIWHVFVYSREDIFLLMNVV